MQLSIVIVKEDLPPGCKHNHRPRWYAFNFHDALHLLLFVLTCKQWIPNEQLIQDAAKRPHVDARCVMNAKHDFWGSVEPALDVRVELFILIGGTSKINDFDARLVRLP